eukprot:jgi/Mesvir1/18966/Mv18933-RA.1
MRKKIDSRIRTLVENGVKTRQRSMFVIVGDRGRDQVVNLHYMLSKSVVKARPSVLWCYKKELYLSSHRKKRLKQVKKMMHRGLLDPEADDPFSLFLASTSIRYCYYAETQNILGRTYGMCVLQDFESLSPNVLARTIETVEGGGIIVLLLSNMTSLSSLYTITMDVHARFRTESHQDVVGRFNERFILSLATNPNCLVMDDELNVLPISSHIRNIKPIETLEGEERLTEAEKELRELKSSLKDTQPVGSLVDQCKTLDQAKAVITFLDCASEKTLRSTVALTAARGRGKSAALGVAIAGAVGLGYSNIFVTSPSPENLKTLFEFVFKGFDAMSYKEHIDYDIVESTNPEFNKAIVRVNIYRQHRQTIQYILPQHHEKLAQAELVVIDEAAAIPLPVVKQLLGPYLVFLCSTVNGYEGTGRSLSLKLIQQLREQGAKLSKTGAKGKEAEGGMSARVFKELELAEPIRYAAGDPTEAWLHGLLCLDAANHIPRMSSHLPHPDQCELYYVNRDTLFSYHKASEVFLQRMMALYVASHYKNTPNDLQMLSDAPAHHLFVLLGPVDETSNALPDILCVVQVCLEGAISRESALRSLSQGMQPQGDLIPWSISQQFQDSEFPQFSGARIVRLASHPDLMRAGYGTRTLSQLRRYYEGQLSSLAEDEGGAANGAAQEHVMKSQEDVSILTEVIKPRANLPPLLVSLAERPPEKLQYLGVAYGLTQSLYNFWAKNGYLPLYMRQTPSEITGEHTCIMLAPLHAEQTDLPASARDGSDNWVVPFNRDFRKRFLSLLGMSFRTLAPALALSILNPKAAYSEEESQRGITEPNVVVPSDRQGVAAFGFSPFDMKRLDSYSRNLVDYHIVLDLVPDIARLYFLEKVPVTLSYGQQAILLALGLQHLEVADVEAHLSLPSNQVLALFNKAMRKIHKQLNAVAEQRVEAALPRGPQVKLVPHSKSLDEDLDDGAKQIMKSMREQAALKLQPADLAKYAIGPREEGLNSALRDATALAAGGTLAVKTKAKEGAKRAEPEEEEMEVKVPKSGKKVKKAKK